MVHVTKKNHENINSLVRRFSKLVRESGLISDVRSKKYYQKKRSKSVMQDSAAWREKVRKLRRELIKRGELQYGEKIDPERLRREIEKVESN